MPTAEALREIALHEYGRVEVAGLTAAQVAWLRAQQPALMVAPLFGGDVQISAHDTVGTLIGSGLRVQIRPKVPLRNLFYLLSYAYDVPTLRRPLDPLIAADDIFLFVVTFFRRNVEHLVRQGIYRAYLSRDAQLPTLRGRLRLPQQVRRPPPPLAFDQHVNDLTADIRENQILQHTLWLLSRVPALSAEHAALRRVLPAFAEVAPAAMTPADCDAVVYHRLNQRYQTAIGLARLLLAHLSVESGGGRQPFATWLLPMSQVFERFVGRYLHHHLPSGWTVALKQSIAIDAAGRETGQLDILLKAAEWPLLVIDTKYKLWQGGPSPEDRNQMFTYCRSTGVPAALLLYPQPLPPPSYLSTLPDGVTLRAHGFDLAADLPALRAALTTWIAAEVAAHASP